MKDRSVPILLVLVVAAFSFIVVQQWVRNLKKVDDQIYRIAFGINPESLSLIEFRGTNGIVQCVKENGVWMVGDSKQAKGRADEGLVRKVVDGLNKMGRANVTPLKKLESRGLSLKDFGMDPPVVEIITEDLGGRRVWHVGETTPSRLEVYVSKVGSEEIFTTPKMVLGFIPPDHASLRNRIVFSGQPSGIKRIEIRGSGGFIRILKDAGNSWRIQQPIVALADPYEISDYVEALFQIRIEDFFEQNVSDLSAYGLQGENRQVSIGASDGSSRTLVLGDPVPGRSGLVYARRLDDTAVFALREDVLGLLDVTATDLRDSRVLSLDKDKITSVMIQHGEDRISMSVDSNANWVVTSPVAWKADRDSVFNLADLWAHAVILDYDAGTNAVPPEWIFEFGDSSTITNRIEVLPAGGRKDGLMIRMNGQSDLYQINLPEIPGSVSNPLGYKSRSVMDLVNTDISKVSLQKNGMPKQVAERNAAGVFVLMEPVGGGLDSRIVSRMLSELCYLRTTGYVAYNPRDLSIYGLSSPSVEIYVGLGASTELGRYLLIGNETAEGFYAMVKGRDVVFHLEKDTVENLSTSWLKPEASARGDG